MTTTTEQVKNYYDQFKEHQKDLGINIRHRTIFKNLKKAGLKPNSNVLEIGCGIGTVSHLILKYITSGSFVGLDISPESISMARKFNGFHKRAEFLVNDMSNFTHSTKFDFVVFPDVLEHIPVEQHANVFKTIAGMIAENGVVLINIPEPYTLDWVRRNKPEGLQIIDQSLSMKDLCNNCYPYGFYMYSMTPYVLQYEPEDYLSIVLKRDFVRKEITAKSRIKMGIDNYRSKF